jgi:hypothetical protein
MNTRFCLWRKPFQWIILFCLVIAPTGLAAAAPQAELHVCASGCAYSSIQAAVDAAAEGSTIKIAAGTYTGVWAKNLGTTSLNQVVYITKSLTLEGGYSPANWTVSNPASNVTTIDAQGGGRVLYINLVNQSVTLSGLNLINGDGNKAGGFTTTGAGVYAWGNQNEDYNSSIVITNCVISGNTTNRSAAGLSLGGMNVTVSGSTIDHNTIQNTGGNGVSGGGIQLWHTNAQIAGNQFLNNKVPIGAYYGDSGGGLHMGYSTVTMNGNTFQGNQAQEGGGVSALLSPLTMSNNQFISNTAANGGGVYYSPGTDAQATITMTGNTFSANTANGGGGGGAWISGYLATVSRNTFDQNTTEGDGGGLIANATHMTIDHNQFTNNSAWYDGGGLYLVGTPEVKSNLITGNTANHGGGVSVNGRGSTHPALTNNIITDNQVFTEGTNPHLVGRGSAVYVEDAAADLMHTTIARNSGGDGSSIYVTNYNFTNSHLTLTNTILAAGATGLSVQNGCQAAVDAILWHLVPTKSAILANDTVQHEFEGDPLFDTDGYHLLDGSAAIGVGLASTVTTDIDNQARPNRAKTVNLPDLGADEYYSPDQIPAGIYLPLIVR